MVAISGVDPDRVTFHSLDDMVTTIPNFEARWIHEQERLRELWQQGDPAVRAAYETTTAASRTSVPTLDYDPAVLAAAYDPEQTDLRCATRATISTRWHTVSSSPTARCCPCANSRGTCIISGPTR